MRRWAVVLVLGVVPGVGLAALAGGCRADVTTTHIGFDSGPDMDATTDSSSSVDATSDSASEASHDASGGGADATMPPDGGGPDVTSSDSPADTAHADMMDAGLQPPPVAPGHLQLWLSADRGVSCVSAQVTSWADLSGHGRNATSGSHVGPECLPALHDLAGVSLPYFSAPGTTAPFNAETLDVNLSFLANTEFTIFVVERRWADWSPGAGKNEMLIGTDYPNEAVTTCPAAGYQINLGYVYYDGFPALDYESVCYRPYSGTRGQAPDASALPPSPPVLDMLRLWEDAGTSPTVWQNGLKINAGGASGGPGSGFVGGAIGRAFGVTGDNRFQGDIAEVMVFDAALTDAERLQMEAYFKAHWQLQ